jgi:hypothetical protein
MPGQVRLCFTEMGSAQLHSEIGPQYLSVTVLAYVLSKAAQEAHCSFHRLLTTVQLQRAPFVGFDWLQQYVAAAQQVLQKRPIIIL